MPRSIIQAVDLLPCIIQDARTGEVLTLAYMNDEALARTRETGEMWSWSRSRQELWHKGETSGNVQRLKELRLDCDQDAILALVEPAGPGLPHRRAHVLPQRRPRPGPGRGARDPGADDRRAARGPARGELHRRALADRELAGAKVREEAEEVARAAREEPDERVAEEAADVLYHLAVLMAERGMQLSDAYEVLQWPSPLATSSSTPSVEEVRELAKDHSLVPLRHTFIADCETPVSAYLKLRGDGPSFLLESAEQASRGAGRSSGSGRAPRSAWITGSTPTRTGWPDEELADTGSPRSTACRRSPAASWACSATTSPQRGADHWRAQPRRRGRPELP